jgi:hypothetical protein
MRYSYKAAISVNIGAFSPKRKTFWQPVFLERGRQIDHRPRSAIETPDQQYMHHRPNAHATISGNSSRQNAPP